MPRLKIAVAPNRSNWVDVMRAAYERASYKDAARTFDYFAGSAAPFDAALLRARIFLRDDEYPSVIRLLTDRKGSGQTEPAQRAMLLGAANGEMAKFAAADEFFDEASFVRGFEVDNDAALIAVESAEETRGKADQPPGRIARHRLDLDHVGAEIGEDQARARTHDGVAEFEHANVGKR